MKTLLRKNWLYYVIHTHNTYHICKTDWSLDVYRLYYYWCICCYLMQEHILKIDHVFLQALKGSKIQVETSYCSQDPRDRFNSSHYSYRTHHPTYRVMMSFLFYLCLFLYHILLSLFIFKTVLKTCPHLTFKATIRWFFFWHFGPVLCVWK